MELFTSKRKARWAEIEALMVAQERDDASSGAPEFSDTVSYEEAGLEERRAQPLFGNTDVPMGRDALEGGIHQYMDWFLDGEGSQVENFSSM